MSTMSSSFIAHKRQATKHYPEAYQNLDSHLTEVGDLASGFAQKIEVSDAGRVLGLLHDFGKYSKQFQDYIRSATGDLDRDDADYVDAVALKGKVDHSSAGAQLIWQRLKRYGGAGQGELVAQIMALCIASHHSGLINCIDKEGNNTFNRRLGKDDDLTHLRECLDQAESKLLASIDGLLTKELVKRLFGKMAKLCSLSSVPQNEAYSKVDSFNLGFFTRFLFSCLIDADRLNSAEFETPSRKQQRISRQVWLDWNVAIERFESHSGGF